MQLKNLFADETSRANTDFVLNIILQKPELLNELIDLVFLKEEPYSRRAIWVLDIYDEGHSERIKPFIGLIINNLSFEGHDAYKRHSLRILSRHEIPETDEVKVFNYCLKIITGNEAVAPKYHAMKMLYRFSEKEPSLRHEVAAAIEIGIQEGSAGIKNIGLKILKKLNKLH